MSELIREKIETIPHGRLGIIAMPGTEEMAQKVNSYISKCRKEVVSEFKNDVSLFDYVQDNYIINCVFDRFATGEGKATIKETVRGYDLYIISDCFNYSVTHELYNFKDANGNPVQFPMTPDEHFADLKRVISAVAKKAKRITVIMPMLYEGRQHRRQNRESLDCALMLQELENMGVANIITFDAHDPRVQNAIRIGFESVSPTYQMIKALARYTDNQIKFNSDSTMMISPDEGGMGRCVYYSEVLGVQLGMFYKRRDFSRVVGGSNPVVAHEFLGSDCNGKNVIVVDDMISSGKSMLDVCKDLKTNYNANKVYVFSSFGLFTSGYDKFDEAYEKGYIEQIFTTNLIYTPEELKHKPWHTSVDLSKFLSFIIDTLNHDESVSTFLDPIDKIHRYVDRWNLK